MTEALIGNLARIRALRVVSRTSVMRFKGSQTSLTEIARALNVKAVIEGSVQRTSDRVKISIQLIHSPTDTHLWAREYEREPTDVLDPLLSTVHSGFGRILYRARRFDEAISHLNQAIALEPWNYRGAYVRLADVYEEMG